MKVDPIKKRYPTQICDFCQELDSRLGRFPAIYGSALRCRICYYGKNFVVFPTIGQIAPNYLLIVSKKHYTALGQMCWEEFEEVEMLIERISYFVRQQLSLSPVIFEHGTMTGAGQGGCSVSHMHLHVVPCAEKVDLLRQMSIDLPVMEIDSMRGLRAYATEGASYLYYRTQDERQFATAVQNLPSQYMRKVLASELGVSRWDWREYGPERELMAAYEFFKDVLNKNSP